MVLRREDIGARPTYGKNLAERSLWADDAAGPRVATEEELLATIRQAPRSVKGRHRRLVAEAKALAAAARAAGGADLQTSAQRRPGAQAREKAGTDLSASPTGELSPSSRRAIRRAKAGRAERRLRGRRRRGAYPAEAVPALAPL
jgi:hypothetical protein